MGIWAANTPLQTKAKCARCGKEFIPKKDDQKYGPTCARIMSADHIEVKNTKGEVGAVIV